MARPTKSPRDFDAVVVGSGIGGLASAALLGRLAAKRVLVLERHFRAGGFTHTFSRPGGYRWDVGVHYVGADVVKPGMPRDAFVVATGGAVRWRKMEDPFERLVFPGLEVALRSGREALVEDLGAAFPREREAIRAWLGDVDRAVTALGVLGARSLVPGPVQAIVEAALSRRLRLARTPVRAALEGRFADPRLRAVIGARWADHGLPPAQSAFAAHAVIARHYLDGAYYPEGSASVIADGARRVIEAAGGEVRVNAEVATILVKSGRATGVRLASGEEVLAPTVISDAGARNTFLRLVPDEVRLPFRDALRAAPRGMATATLYLGLSASPAQLGIHGENVWIHDDLDHDAMWARRNRVLEGEVSHVYLSFPSMKDPAARRHTAEIITGLDAAELARWAGAGWKRRGPEYERVKDRIADAMLELVERRLPGFRSLVAYRELSTPLSTEHFTAHPGGEIYGIPWTPERLGMRFLRARTPVPGLFLTGADALFPGVVGALMGGVFCAGAAAGVSLLGRVRAEARRITATAPPTPSETRPSTA